MTLEQLQEIFPNATFETWHQHPNGGGWVETSVKMAKHVFIGEDTLVYDASGAPMIVKLDAFSITVLLFINHNVLERINKHNTVDKAKRDNK